MLYPRLVSLYLPRSHDRKYTQRYIFEILSNQPEIRLYLPFSVWFGTKRTVSVWFQINRKIVNTIWFRVDLIKFRRDFCRVYTIQPNTPSIVYTDNHLSPQQALCIHTQFNFWFSLNQSKSDCIYNFQWIWNQTKICLVQNHSEKWYIHSEFGWSNKNQKSMSLCVS